jgi:hypothetical protein
LKYGEKVLTKKESFPSIQPSKHRTKKYFGGFLFIYSFFPSPVDVHRDIYLCGRWLAGYLCLNTNFSSSFSQHTIA